MKKNCITFLALLITLLGYAQKDSLQLGDSYWEDQLYIGVTYNQLYNQPTNVVENGFSFGISGGYIKDIPLTLQGDIALGIGLGYAYNTFNHGFKISNVGNNVVFETAANIPSNKLKIHDIELPIEFRWRTSTANKYKFWRIYGGIKLSYNLKNAFNYSDATGTTTFSNVARYQKFQYGLTLAGGYAAFNVYVYYGLTPMLKDANLGLQQINTKTIRMGLVFYIL